MTSSFDAYHKWLGIPPEDQPAHHYRLLGVEPFESDPDVIVIAADGRMAQLKHFQTGKYSKLSQALLNEIAAAKVCLLNPEKREEYDDDLRQRLEEAKKPAVKAAPAGRKPDAQAAAGESETDDEAMPGAAAPQINPAGASSYVSRHSRKPGRPWLLPAAGAVVAVAVIVALVFALRDDNDNGTALQGDPPVGQGGNGLSNRPPKVKHSDPPNPDLPPDDAPPDDPGNGPPIDPDTVASAADPGRSLADLVDPMDPGNAPPDDGHPVPEEPSPGDPPVAERTAVPDAEAKKEAEGKVRVAFSEEFAAAKTPELKLELAETLLAESREPGNTTAVRFVLMQLACETAAEAGGLNEALAATAALEKQFAVNGRTIRGYVLDAVLKSLKKSRRSGTRDADALRAIAMTATAQAAAALAIDDLVTADVAAQVACEAASATKDKYFQIPIDWRAKEIASLKTYYGNRVKQAQEALATADNPAANLIVGEWNCFYKGQWQLGLPMLAKSEDADLADLAKADLTQPEDAKGRVRLGDKWFDVAKRKRGSKYVQSHVYERAKHWYELALAQLAGVTQKKPIENQLTVIAKELRELGPRVAGTVEQGNVALATNGTTVTGVKSHPEVLLDGNSTRFSGNEGFAISPWPSVWTITFKKQYQLQEIRFRFYDHVPRRFARYKIEVTEDGKKFDLLVDRSKGEWESWQVITFPARPVKSIRLHGLYNSMDSGFYVVEFEAYCTPPRTPPPPAVAPR